MCAPLPRANVVRGVAGFAARLAFAAGFFAGFAARAGFLALLTGFFAGFARSDFALRDDFAADFVAELRDDFAAGFARFSGFAVDLALRIASKQS